MNYWQFSFNILIFQVYKWEKRYYRHLISGISKAGTTRKVKKLLKIVHLLGTMNTPNKCDKNIAIRLRYFVMDWSICQADNLAWWWCQSKGQDVCNIIWILPLGTMNMTNFMSFRPVFVVNSHSGPQCWNKTTMWPSGLVFSAKTEGFEVSLYRVFQCLCSFWTVSGETPAAPNVFRRNILQCVNMSMTRMPWWQTQPWHSPHEVLMASRSSAYFHLLSSYFLAPAAALEAWTCGPLTQETHDKDAGSQQQRPTAVNCGIPAAGDDQRAALFASFWTWVKMILSKYYCINFERGTRWVEFKQRVSIK